MDLNKQISTKQSIIFIVIIAIFAISLDQYVQGQEVDMTEEASTQAKEILCKEYNLEYCEGQKVNNNTNSSNSTTRPKPELDCFTTGESKNIFSEYYGWSRCVLR